MKGFALIVLIFLILLDIIEGPGKPGVFKF